MPGLLGLNAEPIQHLPVGGRHVPQPLVVQAQGLPCTLPAPPQALLQTLLSSLPRSDLHQTVMSGQAHQCQDTEMSHGAHRNVH